MKVVRVGGGNTVFSGGHSLISGEKERFGGGEVSLTGEGGSQQTPGQETLPVVGIPGALDLQDLAQEGLAGSELALRLIGHRQAHPRFERVGVLRPQNALPRLERLPVEILCRGMFSREPVEGGLPLQVVESLGMLRPQAT